MILTLGKLVLTSELNEFRGKTKFPIEPYISYGEEETTVLTKKFANLEIIKKARGIGC